jgi:hypothetical protein
MKPMLQNADSKTTNSKEKPKLSDNTGFCWFAFDVIEFQTSPDIQGMSAAERGVWVTLSAIQWHDNYLPNTEQLLSKRSGFEVRLLHRWLTKYGHLFPICLANPRYRANPKLWNLAVTVGKIVPPENTNETTETKSNESETTTVPPSASSGSSPSQHVVSDGNWQPQAVADANSGESPALKETGVAVPADPRQWNRDVAGISADRIRNCVKCQLDHNRNRWYIANISVATLAKESFVRKLNVDTPPDWSPEKSKSSSQTPLSPDLNVWVKELQEKSNEC